VLSGGQAPGGHNVIAGLFDGLLQFDPCSELHGFLGGPRGLIEGKERPLDAGAIAPYRHMGGFDLLGSGRDKIESVEQLAACRATCERLRLDGLVVIGGDDSNTNAATLAEHFRERGLSTAVVGVPKTIDGDLKSDEIEASFGFDTATKVYAELIGNLCRDARSARKYWHFVRLMGRSASHVTLECALQTQPNVALIGEEVERHGRTLAEIIDDVAQAVRRRAAAGTSYGVVLVPEGLIEFVPEMRGLIDELNRLFATAAAEFDRLATADDRERFVRSRLSPPVGRAFAELPERIRQQLLLDRDAHGNVLVSQIDTELLLIDGVRRRVAAWQKSGEFHGKLGTLGHFFGYEGRCAQPTNFDADYTYALGRVASRLVAAGHTGYMASLRGLVDSPRSWRAQGVPLTSLMRLEQRHGRQTPVVAKALVCLDGAPFRHLAAERERWAIEDAYVYPGAIQYFGPPEVCNAPTRTLALESAEREG
jgi:pyrophosphate--fructose-6-phosphate 1-phosphotransferase